MFLNIGFGNYVNCDKIIAIVSPDSSPMRRVIAEARKKGTLVDASQGRKTRSVIVMENNDVILSAVITETIIARNAKGGKK